MAGIRTIAIGAAIIVGGGAMGQPAAPEAATMLHLSASASVPASPDQLVIAMLAQVTSASAAAAQRGVNGLIADGMQIVHGVAGVDARAIFYSVTPSDEKRATWTAQQTLELRGPDGQKLLDLAGKLQERGLAAATLDWQLSPPLRRKAHDEAITAALKELQTRAASAAAALGLHVDHATDVRIDSPIYQARAAISMMAMAPRGVPPPQATSAPEDVTASVSADVVLRP
jgi:uncharacterized protein YggE